MGRYSNAGPTPASIARAAAERGDWLALMDANAEALYERRVAAYEAEGITRSDAQAIVDAEMMQENGDEG